MKEREMDVVGRQARITEQELGLSTREEDLRVNQKDSLERQRSLDSQKAAFEGLKSTFEKEQVELREAKAVYQKDKEELDSKKQVHKEKQLALNEREMGVTRGEARIEEKERGLKQRETNLEAGFSLAAENTQKAVSQREKMEDKALRKIYEKIAAIQEQNI